MTEKDILNEEEIEKQFGMALKYPQLVKAPNPILTIPCHPVEWSPLVDRILDTMITVMEIHRGIGLAAPQMGLPLNLLVAKLSDGIVTAINPVLKETSEEIVWIKEGCLSYPGYFVSIPRPKSIVVELEGENPDFPLTTTLEGMDARIILHEMDHLKGICLADRILELPKNKKRIAQQKLAKAMRKKK